MHHLIKVTKERVELSCLRVVVLTRQKSAIIVNEKIKWTPETLLSFEVILV